MRQRTPKTLLQQAMFPGLSVLCFHVVYLKDTQTIGSYFLHHIPGHNLEAQEMLLSLQDTVEENISCRSFPRISVTSVTSIKLTHITIYVVADYPIVRTEKGLLIKMSNICDYFTSLFM